MTVYKWLPAVLVVLVSSVQAQPHQDHFRLLAVTERGLVYVDTVATVRDSGWVNAVLRFEHDSAMATIGEVESPKVSDMEVRVNCRAGSLFTIGARYYSANGKSVWVRSPVPEAGSVGHIWSALPPDAIRMYSRVCALFAPEYAHDLLPERRKTRGRP